MVVIDYETQSEIRQHAQQCLVQICAILHKFFQIS